MSAVADAQIVELPRYVRDGGALVVAETAAHVPFAIVRVFTLQAPPGAVRGCHAHRRCSQFMLCVSGTTAVMLDDGVDRQTFELSNDNRALFVPPMLWTVVTFREPNGVLTVLCDRPYEPDDYIHDYARYSDAQRAALP